MPEIELYEDEKLEKKLDLDDPTTKFRFKRAMKGNEDVIDSLWIRNPSKYEYVIEGLELPDGLSTDVPDGTSIPAYDVKKVNLIWKAVNSEKPLSENVKIKGNFFIYPDDW